MDGKLKITTTTLLYPCLTEISLFAGDGGLNKAFSMNIRVFSLGFFQFLLTWNHRHSLEGKCMTSTYQFKNSLKTLWWKLWRYFWCFLGIYKFRRSFNPKVQCLHRVGPIRLWMRNACMPLSGFPAESATSAQGRAYWAVNAQHHHAFVGLPCWKRNTCMGSGLSGCERTSPERLCTGLLGFLGERITCLWMCSACLRMHIAVTIFTGKSSEGTTLVPECIALTWTRSIGWTYLVLTKNSQFYFLEALMIFESAQ